MFDKNKELNSLENIAQDSWYAKDVNLTTIEYSYHIFKRHFVKGSVLELGPAEGVMTDRLVNSFDDITVVEGSKSFAQQLKDRHSSLNVVHSLFEDFQPTRKFDNIILGHVLEHVDDPVQILSLVSGWLSENGRVFTAVPNSRSLHRQAAVIMGLLEHEKQLNPTDLHHGHRRVYDPDSFRADFKKAGLEIEMSGGYWIKPLSNNQLTEQWTPEMIWSFMKLGERYPDIAAEIYVIAALKCD